MENKKHLIGLALIALVAIGGYMLITLRQELRETQTQLFQLVQISRAEFCTLGSVDLRLKEMGVAYEPVDEKIVSALDCANAFKTE